MLWGIEAKQWDGKADASDLVFVHMMSPQMKAQIPNDVAFTFSKKRNRTAPWYFSSDTPKRDDEYTEMEYKRLT